MKTKQTNSYLCLLSLLTLLLLSGQAAFAQTEADSTEAEEKIDPTTITDGPYILYQNDSTLSVNYLCYGQHHHRTITFDSVAYIPNCCFPILPGSLIVSREPIIQNEFKFENVSRLLAISDIHGEYEAMVSFLTTAEVIDSNQNWQWETGHLVIDGDVFDRGDKVSKCLWFLYRLQKQAAEAGGAVHYLLGNHELMVLRGDDRYLHKKYTEVTIPTMGVPHTNLISQQTIIGRWLRSRPIMIVIDSILFVHGGVSLDLTRTGLTVSEINAAARIMIDQPKEIVRADSLWSLIKGRQGPFWYRGLLIEYKQPQITSAELDSVLAYFEAQIVVVGHSEMDSIYSHFESRLFGIDIPVDDLGGFQGLLIQDRKFYRVTTEGELQLIGTMDLSEPTKPN